MASRPSISRRNMLRGAAALSASAAAAGGGFVAVTPAFADATTAVPEPEIDSTADWGANPDDGRLEMNNYPPTYLVVHHTEYPNSEDLSREQAHYHAKQVQDLHQIENGWPDTGYQFMISRGGYITEGRHRSLEGLRDGGMFVHGSHAGSPANSESVAVSMEGNYHMDTQPPQAQWDALVELLAHACTQYGIASDSDGFIIGHRDAQDNRDCPGNNFYPRMDELRDAVRNRLSSS